MKKIDIIFDDITILNFSFFWKLLKRYVYFLIITPVVVSLISYHFYKSQHEIYVGSVSFKTMEASSGDSATSAIASLIGEKTSTISAPEVVGIADSVNFLQGLAESVYTDEGFESLNLNSIYSRKLKSHKSIFLHCEGSKNCEITVLRGIIRSFFVISRDEDIYTKFSVKVKTLDQKTTEFLVELLRHEIQSYRTQTIKHSLGEHRKLSEKLIKDKKYDIEASDVQKLLQKQKTFQSTKFELRTKLDVHGKTLGRERIRLEEASVRYSTNVSKNKASKNISVEDLETWKRLRSKLKSLSADIFAVSGANEIASLSKQIVEDLVTEKKSVEARLKVFKRSRSVSSKDFSTIKNQKVQNFAKYNVDILKKQVQQLEDRYDELFSLNEKNDHELESIHSEIVKHSPNLKYLELLSQKRMQITLLESTIISDFIFDNLSSPVSVYKRNSLGMIVLFSIIITVFLLILSVMIRFFFDSRIFDEEELISNFRDLEIIGNTPDFK
jgi:hypothetical protein